MRVAQPQRIESKSDAISLLRHAYVSGSLLTHQRFLLTHRRYRLECNTDAYFAYLSNESDSFQHHICGLKRLALTLEHRVCVCVCVCVCQFQATDQCAHTPHPPTQHDTHTTITRIIRGCNLNTHTHTPTHTHTHTQQFDMSMLRAFCFQFLDILVRKKLKAPNDLPTPAAPMLWLVNSVVN